jgi:membrane-associated phospholipid phosphatase
MRNRIVEPLSNRSQTLRLAKVVALACWLAAGVLLIFLDGRLQPCLTVLGSNAVIRGVAEHWQDLGATLGIVCFLVAGVLNVPKDRGRAFVTFALSVAGAGAAVQVLKHLVGRARPNLVHDQSWFYGPFGVFHPGTPLQLDAMPSGHTTAAFAMAVALSYRWRRLAILWFGLAAGVGVSRTLVDRHFPSDVVVGSWLGTLIGWSVCTWRGRREARPGTPSLADATRARGPLGMQDDGVLRL